MREKERERSSFMVFSSTSDPSRVFAVLYEIFSGAKSEESNFQWLLASKCDFKRNLRRIPTSIEEFVDISIKGVVMATEQCVQLTRINRLIKNKRHRHMRNIEPFNISASNSIRNAIWSHLASFMQFVPATQNAERRCTTPKESQNIRFQNGDIDSEQSKDGFFFAKPKGSITGTRKSKRNQQIYNSKWRNKRRPEE